ncbi:MAG: response regulator transcription factor [Bryobacteraceae bacterium]
MASLVTYPPSGHLNSAVPIPATRGITILLASVQALFRESLKSVLESRFDDIHILESSSCSRLSKTVEHYPVDVVLLDCDLGDAALQSVQCSTMQELGIPVIVIASAVRNALAKRLLHAGAVSVVWKRSNTQDLITAIREVIKGQDWPHVTASGQIRSSAVPEWEDLTERQSRVFDGILEGRANKEIAAQLSVSESSVKCTVRQLFSKYLVHTRAQLVRVGVEGGHILDSRGPHQ